MIRLVQFGNSDVIVQLSSVLSSSVSAVKSIILLNIKCPQLSQSTNVMVGIMSCLQVILRICLKSI